MRNTIFSVAFLMGVSAATTQAQNVRLEGNVYKAVRKADTATAKPTGRYYIDKAGSMWPVFRTQTGKLYALRTSKAGKEYKYYLKPDTDTTNWEGN
jgi:hypothetical protein